MPKINNTGAINRKLIPSQVIILKIIPLAVPITIVFNKYMEKVYFPKIPKKPFSSMFSFMIMEWIAGMETRPMISLEIPALISRKYTINEQIKAIKKIFR